MKFRVRTLHTGTNRFIVPVEVEAESHLEAARERLSWQSLESQADTKALLVEEEEQSYGFAGPQIFFTENRMEVVSV